MLEPSYDAVVAGAGIAGTACAGMLARAGLSVLLVDARSEENAGARWVNGVPARAFDVAGIARPVGAELVAAGDTFTLTGPSGAHHVHLDDHGVIEVDMRLLGRRLREDARKAGATLRFGRTITDAEVKRGRLTSIELGRDTIRAPLFVDATGLSAVLRRAVFPGWPSVRREHLCTAAQMVHGIADHDGARRWLSSVRGRPGEVLAKVGLAGGYSVLNVRVDLERGFVAVLTGTVPDAAQRPSGLRLLDDFVAENTWIGARRFGGSGAIPLRRPYSRLGAPGLALIGDAACLTFAGHGSGIATGLFAARLLTDVVRSSGDPGALETNWSYAAKLHHAQGGLLLAYDLIRRVTQRFDAAETDAMFAADLASQASLRAGFDQEPPPMDLGEMARTARKALATPRLSLRLAHALRHLPATVRHGRSYPLHVDWKALRRYEAKSARLVGDPIDPIE